VRRARLEMILPARRMKLRLKMAERLSKLVVMRRSEVMWIESTATKACHGFI
jgi:hypothetical protein